MATTYSYLLIFGACSQIFTIRTEAYAADVQISSFPGGLVSKDTEEYAK